MDMYVYYIDEWENLSDNELEAWVKRVENDLNTIPFVILHREEDEK